MQNHVVQSDVMIGRSAAQDAANQEPSTNFPLLVTRALCHNPSTVATQQSHFVVSVVCVFSRIDGHDDDVMTSLVRDVTASVEGR